MTYEKDNVLMYLFQFFWKNSTLNSICYSRLRTLAQRIFKLNVWPNNRLVPHPPVPNTHTHTHTHTHTSFGWHSSHYPGVMSLSTIFIPETSLVPMIQNPVFDAFVQRDRCLYRSISGSCVRYKRILVEIQTRNDNNNDNSDRGAILCPDRR